MKTERTASPRRRKTRFGSRRADVVELLQRGIGTVSELAKRLQLTDNAVRSHLFALEEEGLVHRKGLRIGTRRPHELYRLSPRAQKLLVQASDASLISLLDAMKQRLSGKQLRELLKGGGAALAARVGADATRKTFRARVQNAARLLNALGGSTKVEKEGDKFCIRSQGCPLTFVVAEHPETCLLVENFLARVTGSKVTEHCQRSARSRCQFLVTPV
jgi:predicted ArsR family transcriptional regulator